MRPPVDIDVDIDGHLAIDQARRRRELQQRVRHRPPPPPPRQVSSGCSNGSNGLNVIDERRGEGEGRCTPSQVETILGQEPLLGQAAAGDGTVAERWAGDEITGHQMRSHGADGIAGQMAEIRSDLLEDLGLMAVLISSPSPLTPQSPLTLTLTPHLPLQALSYVMATADAANAFLSETGIPTVTSAPKSSVGYGALEAAPKVR